MRWIFNLINFHVVSTRTCTQSLHFSRYIDLDFHMDYRCMAFALCHKLSPNSQLGNGTINISLCVNNSFIKWEPHSSDYIAKITLKLLVVSSHFPNTHGSSSHMVKPQKRPVKCPIHWQIFFFPIVTHFPPFWHGLGIQSSTQSSVVVINFIL